MDKGQANHCSRSRRRCGVCVEQWFLIPSANPHETQQCQQLSQDFNYLVLTLIFRLEVCNDYFCGEPLRLDFGMKNCNTSSEPSTGRSLRISSPTGASGPHCGLRARSGRIQIVSRFRIFAVMRSFISGTKRMSRMHSAFPMVSSSLSYRRSSASNGA